MEIRLEFAINTDDVKAYYAYCLLHSPKARRKFSRNRIWYIIFTIIALLFGLAFWLDKKMAIPALLFSIFCFYNIFFGEKRERKILVKQVDWLSSKETNEVIGSHKFTITENKIIDVSEKGESATRWEFMEEVACVETHCFFTTRASMGFYIVPRNAFTDDASFNQFTNTVKKYHLAASQTIIAH